MNKKLIVLAMTVFFAVAMLTGSAIGRLKKMKLLSDGLALSGAYGKLISDNNEVWFFEFASDVNSGKCKISEGTKLQLLPSESLEMMTVDVKARGGADYRLWGKVTQYKSRNFIFAAYFLPVSKIKPPKQQDKKPKVTINEPNDPLAIPEDVIAKLSSRRVVRPARLRKDLKLKKDFVLVDRIGFLDYSGREIQFVLDSLGWNAGGVSFSLLGCVALERIERKQTGQLEPIRFKVVGIVTKFKGKDYLLLQRAVRLYSHQNFGR